MEVVRVEGEEVEPDEFGEGSGLCEIKRHSKNQQQGQQQTAATSLTETSTAAGTAVKYNRKTARQVRQIARASRMPDLPTDDYKVVVRPRGGFNVSDYKMDRIYCCLRSAAEIGREAAEEDSICLNFKQNIVVLSTPSEDRAKRYGAISKLRIGEREFEASAYRAAPENTSKGLVRGISNDESPEDIVKSLITQRNPAVLHAKRMGNTDNVIVLFDGFYVPRYVYYGAMLVRCSLYRKHIDVCYGCGRLGHRADVCPNPNNKMCRGCGYSNPPQEHLCDPKCQPCGKGHVTGDRKCKAKYKIPYLVKRRQWERRTREEDAAVEAYDNGYNSSSTANYASQDRHLRREGRSASRGAIGGAGKSRSRSSARSRSRSLTGSRASKPRSKSKMRVAAGPGAMQPTGFVNHGNSSQYGNGSYWQRQHQQQQQHQHYKSNVQEVSWADVAASPGGDGAAGRRDGVVVSGGGGPGPGRPVPVEVNTVDDSSVETADEREDHPVSSKRAALDPERPTTEPRSTSYERLKKRIENIETSLDERFASQTEQINKMFTVVNNSVAKLAEQMTQAIAALTARMDDFEARPPPLAGRPLRATGKPYARPQQQQTPITDAETQHQQPRAEAETTASCVDRRYGDVAGRRGARSSQSNSGAARSAGARANSPEPIQTGSRPGAPLPTPSIVRGGDLDSTQGEHRYRGFRRRITRSSSDHKQQPVCYTTVRQNFLRQSALRRSLGKSRHIVKIFAGGTAPDRPDYVRYWGATYVVYPFRDRIEACYNCRKVGHRTDVCPLEKQARCKRCGDDTHATPEWGTKVHHTSGRNCMFKYYFQVQQHKNNSKNGTGTKGTTIVIGQQQGGDQDNTTRINSATQPNSQSTGYRDAVRGTPLTEASQARQETGTAPESIRPAEEGLQHTVTTPAMATGPTKAKGLADRTLAEQPAKW
ncbi:hypothetical protein HPB52_009301 [Rhipicephalus sanguineus]|uniref:CCHC-type domain-containing protein n=1 Tax=Rhipicephalus sanguineus TaxID=34632 RepID=A0A9D4PC24_RHISA|nr:hypothetical protein HPB52_009301 [Rhipicephalus sanguineus]